MSFSTLDQSPGIYIFEKPSGVTVLSGVSTSITVFVGPLGLNSKFKTEIPTSSRDPRNPEHLEYNRHEYLEENSLTRLPEIVRVNSYEEFLTKFSLEAASDRVVALEKFPNLNFQLLTSVRSFFLNGGSDCYVLNVASGEDASAIIPGFGPGGAIPEVLEISTDSSITSSMTIDIANMDQRTGAFDLGILEGSILNVNLNPSDENTLSQQSSFESFKIGDGICTGVLTDFTTKFGQLSLTDTGGNEVLTVYILESSTTRPTISVVVTDNNDGSINFAFHDSTGVIDNVHVSTLDEIVAHFSSSPTFRVKIASSASNLPAFGTTSVDYSNSSHFRYGGIIDGKLLVCFKSQFGSVSDIPEQEISAEGVDDTLTKLTIKQFSERANLNLGTIDGASQFNLTFSLVDVNAFLETGQYSLSTDSVSISKRDYERCLSELELIDIFNLLVIVKYKGLDDAVYLSLLTIANETCKNRMAFLLVDPLDAWTVEEVRNKNMGARIGALRSSLSYHTYASVFYPNVIINESDVENDFNLSEITIGPAALVAGLMSRRDPIYGVWTAPAGTDAVLGGIKGLEFDMRDDHNGPLNSLAINGIRNFKQGIVVWGARTVKGFEDNDYKYLNVRRFALYIEQTLQREMRWVVFKNNFEPLWAQIRMAIGGFMQKLFKEGAFRGSTIKDAYKIVCDKSINTIEDQRNGIVNIKIFFAPLYPAEFVVITIQHLVKQE